MAAKRSTSAKPTPKPKPKAKSKSKPKSTSATGRGKHRVRIRMYRHGLGDCFLLSFPRKGKKDFHLMIDCGVVLGTGEPGKVMQQVAKDVKKAVGGTLDVLVITHEHWDHLSGFDKAQARAVFESMKIKALWLGWPEDDTDSLAQSLRDERIKRKAAARAAKAKAKKLGLAETDVDKKQALEAQSRRIAEVLGFFGVKAAGDDEDADGGEDEDNDATGAKAQSGTRGALNFLKEKCRPTILQTGTSLELPGVDDVRVYVIGPPKDGAAMRKTNPHKGEGYGLGDTSISLADAFLASFSKEPDVESERAQPFEAFMRQPLLDRSAVRAAGAAPGEGVPDCIRSYYDHTWRNIDNAWLATGERLALQLDNATNNTSLVLAIELGGEDGDVLLFVGDAQAGNWRSWEERRWKVPDKKGETRGVTSADLLGRTIFYKVGHHGSHNATMREKGLELMKSDRLAAFIPVDTDVAHKVKGWAHMPLPAIRERLEKKCAVVFQSDKPALVKRKVAGTRWKESPQKFEVFMNDPGTKQMKVVGERALYTDYWV